MFARIATLSSLLALLFVSPAAGQVNAARDLQVNWQGPVFLYQGKADLPDPYPSSELLGERIPNQRTPSFARLNGNTASRQVPGSERLKLVGSALDTGGMASDALAHGNYCYVGTSGSLSVFDVSDPTAPVLVHMISETAAVVDKNSTTMAAVMGCSGEVVLFDITNPEAPAEISRVAAPENFYYRNLAIDEALVIATGYGYIEPYGTSAIMQLIDVSDPYSPQVSSTMLGVGDMFRDVLIHDTTAFLTVAGEGLAVFDISDPLVIKQIGFTPVYAYVDGMVYRDGFLFLSGHGLEIVDVSDPSNPQPVSQVGGAYTGDVKISGDIAYVTDDDDRALRIIDISDLFNPVKVAELAAYGKSYYFDLLGDLIFLPDQVYGLIVVDVTDPINPDVLSMTSTGTYAGGVAVEGDLAVVTANLAAVYTVDVSDPFAPEETGFTVPAPDTTPSNTLWQLGVNVSDGTAVTSHWNWGFHTYDVSDPSTPTMCGGLKNNADLSPVFKVDNLVYTGGSELQVVDITDPANPVQVGTGPSVASVITDIKIAGTTGYMSSYEEVVIFDLTNPIAPVELNRIMAVDYIRGIAVDNGILGVLWDDWYSNVYYMSLFNLYDVSDPEAPVKLSSIQNAEPWLYCRPGGTAFAAENGKFFIAFDEHLVVIDATDPSDPVVAATYPESHCHNAAWMNHEGVCAGNGLVYLTGHHGMEILRFLDVGLFLTPESEPIAVHEGESFGYDMKLKNFTTELKKVRIEIEADAAEGAATGWTAHSAVILLNPGQQVVYKMKHEVPMGASPGSYHLHARAFSNPDDKELDVERVTFEVLAD